MLNDIKNTNENTLIKDTERSFKLSRNEKKLQDIHELKKRSVNILKQIKNKYNTFLLNYDNSIYESTKYILEISKLLKSIGIE